MLRNYLKMALKVLLRKKFYTFISMFGICITLTIFLVVYAFWEHNTGAQVPETKLDRSLFVTNCRIYKKEKGYSSSPVSFYFLDRYVSQLKTPEAMTFYSTNKTLNTYVGEKKIEMVQKFTDAAFWEVMEFQFIEGRPYKEEEVRKGQPVVVLTRDVKEKIFGREKAVGKDVELYKSKYQVIGVVENVSSLRDSYASIYLPNTLNKENLNEKKFDGNYLASLVAKNPSQRKEVQAEFNLMMQQIENPDPEKIQSVHIFADTYLVKSTRQIFGDEEEEGIAKAYLILGVMVFLFMLLPTLNLININISRVRERAEEIGVRKAFGAASTTLVLQFVWENILLTFVCGLISLILAYGIVELINSCNLVPHSRFVVSMPVFWAGIIMMLTFGLISGVYPAWRMSRLHAAEALNKG